MGDHIKAEIDGLRQAAALAQRLHEGLAADKGELDAGLAATHGSWGGDEQGRAFADGPKGHLAGQHASDESLAQAAQAADALAAKLRESADLAEGTDHANARDLGSLA